jgi:hypothetical protein
LRFSEGDFLGVTARNVPSGKRLLRFYQPKRGIAGGLGVRAILLPLSLPLRVSVREKQTIGASKLVFLAPEVDLYQQNGVVVFE